MGKIGSKVTRYSSVCLFLHSFLRRALTFHPTLNWHWLKNIKNIRSLQAPHWGFILKNLYYIHERGVWAGDTISCFWPSQLLPSLLYLESQRQNKGNHVVHLVKLLMSSTLGIENPRPPGEAMSMFQWGVYPYPEFYISHEGTDSQLLHLCARLTLVTMTLPIWQISWKTVSHTLHYT